MCLFMRVVLISNNYYLVIKSNLPLELLGTHTDPNRAKSKETALKKKKKQPDSAPKGSGSCLSCPFSLLHLRPGALDGMVPCRGHLVQPSASGMNVHGHHGGKAMSRIL